MFFKRWWCIQHPSCIYLTKFLSSLLEWLISPKIKEILTNAPFTSKLKSALQLSSWTWFVFFIKHIKRMFVEFKCSTLKMQVDNSITWSLWKIKSFSSVSDFHSVTFGLTKRVLLVWMRFKLPLPESFVPTIMKYICAR